MKENNFIHRITKEQVAQLPLVTFTGEVIVVRTPSVQKEALLYLNQQQYVGVDTETRPSFQHGQHFPTALVQIATTQRCYLFQLNHIGFTEELASLFANPKICKIGLAFHDDLRGLQRLHPFIPANCIDIQKMVLKYGILDLGLQKIFAIIFAKRISKSQQLTNWDNVVLTPDQARYAATDAWATLLIYNELCQTKQLDRHQYETLHQLDLQLQQEHQRQVIEQRHQEHE